MECMCWRGGGARRWRAYGEAEVFRIRDRFGIKWNGKDQSIVVRYLMVAAAMVHGTRT